MKSKLSAIPQIAVSNRVPTRWTPEQLDRLRDQVAAARSNAEIGAVFGVTANAIGQIMQRHEMPKRPRRLGHPFRWNDADNAEFLAGWNDGVGVVELGKKFHVQPSVISHRAKNLGLSARKTHNGWTPADDARLRDLWRERHLTRAQIGEILGRSGNALKHRAKTLKLSRRRAELAQGRRRQPGRVAHNAKESPGHPP